MAFDVRSDLRPGDLGHVLYLHRVHRAVAGLPAAAHLYESARLRPVEGKTHELWGATLTELRYELAL